MSLPGFDLSSDVKNNQTSARNKSIGNINLFPPTIVVNNDPPGHISHHKKGVVVFSVHDLRGVIFDAKKATIMRDLLDETNNITVREILLAPLETQAKALQHDLNLKDLPLFLPIKTIISVLEENRKLRLRRVQIMGLVAFADCYDVSGCNLDYLLFVDYAAEAIPKMKTERGFDSRLRALGSFKSSSAEVRASYVRRKYAVRASYVRRTCLQIYLCSCYCLHLLQFVF